MRTAMALFLTLPLLACAPESLMEQSSETLDDASDDIANMIDDTREELEQSID